MAIRLNLTSCDGLTNYIVQNQGSTAIYNTLSSMQGLGIIYFPNIDGGGCFDVQTGDVGQFPYRLFTSAEVSGTTSYIFGCAACLAAHPPPPVPDIYVNTCDGLTVYQVQNATTDAQYTTLNNLIGTGAAWFPAFQGGVCATVSNQPTIGITPVLHTFTTGEVASILTYLTCTACINDHLPPPPVTYLWLTACNNGDVYPINILTDQTTYNIFLSYVGQVRFFTNIAPGRCFSISSGTTDPAPGIFGIIATPNQAISTQYTDCPQCIEANPPNTNSQFLIIESVCGCIIIPYQYYFWCHNINPPYPAGFYSIPLLDTFLNIDLTCWRIRVATPQETTGLPIIPIQFSCLSNSLNAIQYPSESQCLSDCEGLIQGNIALTNCCLDLRIVVKDSSGTVEYSGTYYIPDLSANYPGAGDCWFAEETPDPWVVDLINFRIDAEPCTDCVDSQCIQDHPCPIAICYRLIPCEEPYADLVATNDLSQYIGQVVMVDGICYTVQPGSEDCTGGVIIEIFDNFTICGDQTGLQQGCKYCDCPPGYYPNAAQTECTKQDCVPPGVLAAPYAVAAPSVDPATSWGMDGARGYQNDLSTLIYPVLGDGTTIIPGPGEYKFVDDNGTGVTLGYSSLTALVFATRFVDTVIWPVETPLNEWVGFTTCINVTQEKVYSFGISADEQFIVKLNGQIITTVLTPNIGYRLWHVFRITLPVGQSVFEVLAQNTSGDGGLGFEIYNTDITLVPPASLQNSTDLAGYLIFSTKTYRETPGTEFQLGNSGYSCPPGYFLTDCDGALQCCKVPITLPFVHCEKNFQLTDCEGNQVPVITNTDLSQYVGQVIKVCIPGVTPLGPTDCQNCDVTQVWSPVSDDDGCSGSYQEPPVSTIFDPGDPIYCYSTCTLFFSNRTGIYSFDFDIGVPRSLITLTGLINSNSHLAVTSNRAWVIDVLGAILEYELVLSPIPNPGGVPGQVQITFIRSIGPGFANVLCAINNTTLLGTNNTLSPSTDLVSYDITGVNISGTTLFTLANSGIIHAALYIPSNTHVLIIGADTVGNFIGEYTFTGTVLSRVTLPFADFRGITIDPTTGNIFVVRSVSPGTLYSVDLITGNVVLTTVVGVNTPTGMARNPQCNVVQGTPSIWPEGCYCIEITEVDFTDTAIPWLYTTLLDYETCETCLQKCYTLTDCTDPTNTIVVNNDLEEFPGNIVKFPRLSSGCWIISPGPNDCSGSITIPGGYTVYTDCETCLPPPPIPPILTGRPVKPGYDTPGCGPEYTERISCTFGQQAYDEMVQARYGIKICCDHDMDKWDVRKQILDLKAIFDPNLCLDITCVPTIVILTETDCEGSPPGPQITITITGNYTTGNYLLQFNSDGTNWVDIDDFTGTSLGTFEYIYTGSFPSHTFLIRVVDADKCSLLSNQVEIITPDC